MSRSDLVLHKDSISNTINIQTDNYSKNKCSYQHDSDFASKPFELIDCQNGFFYDSKNDLFCDQNKQLFFDLENNVYYYYKFSKTSNSYSPRYHSQINNEYWKFIQHMFSNYQTNHNFISNFGAFFQNKINFKSINAIEKETKSINFKDNNYYMAYPPCIRAILIKKTRETVRLLTLGSFFVIPHTGGSIGKHLKTNLVDLTNERDVGKLHASIKYNLSKKAYFIKDENSSYETFLNDSKLEPYKEYKIDHGDKLKIGTYVCFLLHIHQGTTFCEDCEPVQVVNQLKLDSDLNACFSKTCLEDNRKKIKKSNKKKFQDNNYNGRYGKFEVNTNSYVENNIEQNNFGHKLLTKMGWTEGQGLGKNKDGIVEPIEASKRNLKSKIGIGFVRAESKLNSDEQQTCIYPCKSDKNSNFQESPLNE